MSRLTRLMAVACCAAPVTSAGCVHGVTYRMPMPDSLTLGTIRGQVDHADESARMASAGTAATGGTGSAGGSVVQPTPVSVAGK